MILPWSLINQPFVLESCHYCTLMMTNKLMRDLRE
jgi:hypothetical protein